MTINELEPKAIWKHFSDLNAVPRPSKKEERVIQFMVDFGKSLGLNTQVDKTGNVIIKKEGSLHLKGAPAVILQSHLDMVHQKNNDTVFDFDKQGIEMLIDGDWVKANGTTLGADNGLGVATIMALLSSTNIAHPPLEAMFTIDEETGMTGAKELDGSLYDGKTLLNLDTEDDDELSIGCAGGIDTNTSYACELEAIKTGSEIFKIDIKGLNGGHSGMDIDKGLGNANKILNRILYSLLNKTSFQLISFDGGSLRNAIPREAVGVVAVENGNLEAFKSELAAISSVIKTEMITKEANMVIDLIPANTSEKSAVADKDLKKIVQTIYGIPNGVFRMSPDIEGLVETSSSLARVLIKDGKFTSQSLQRSSVDSTKDDVANTVKCSFELMGCTVEQGGDYPGWQPNPNSEILKVMTKLYRDMFNEEPQVKACHAGLECGILGQHLPGVDMISFGPNIRGAHSPEEKVQISSVQKFWKFLLATLEQMN
ncbi:MAG: dipeptidase D [Lentimonas sp.]|jgi:dipeptidase D